MNQESITIYHLYLPEVYAHLRKDSRYKDILTEDAFRNKRIISEFFTSAALEVFAGTSVDRSDIEIEEFGKPILDQVKFEGLHFNISHTDNHLVVAVAPFPLGVDVESVKESYPKHILKRIVHLEDKLRINEASDFYRLWSIKEAFVKYVGKGLQIPLNEVRILSIGSDKCTVKSNDDLAEIRYVDLVDDHVCYVAGKEIFNKKIEIVYGSACVQLLTDHLVDGRSE